MHEVSLIEGIISLVEDARRQQEFSRVLTVRLRLGALGHAEPGALRFCFDVVAAGTIAEGARMEIEIVAGEGWCPACLRSVPMAERFDACPLCGRAGLRMTAGDVLQLAELEVE